MNQQSPSGQQPYEPTQPIYVIADGLDDPVQRIYLPSGGHNEPTERGDASQYLNDLDVTSIPPPPPPPKRHRWWIGWIMAVVLVMVALGGTAAYTFYLVGYSHVDPYQRPSASVKPIVGATPTPTLSPATPTAGATLMPTSSDFNIFLAAFASAMANKQYSTIQSATDTKNFRSVPPNIVGGSGTWQDMYNRLSTGNLSFTIRYPPIMAAHTDYPCLQYNPQGSGSPENPSDMRYVVGTVFMSIDIGDGSQIGQGFAVFAFERLGGPSSSWLWRAVIFDNQNACG